MSTFKVGETVIASSAIIGYQYDLTEGKKYVVTQFCEKDVTPNFTFPEYVTVIGDRGREVTCHTYRFKKEE